jgi:hypothetical protein
MRILDLENSIDIYNEQLYNEDMKPKSIVYLDMDGVIADFFGGIEKLYGVKHWKELTSDRTKDLKAEVIDRITGTNFFETLPKFSTADQLINMIKQFTGGTFSICSSPLRGDNANSAKWKKVWISKNIEQPEKIIITGRKETYAMNKQTKQPNILIDDRPINIQKWQSAGGYGILYQANKDSLSKIKSSLEEFKQKYMVKEGGVGIITKQNTTADVKPGETKRQAAKFGFKLDSKGRPPRVR